MEWLDFDLLFRWFVGLGIDDRVWDHSVFAENRDRVLMSEIAQDLLAALLAEPKIKRLLSHEHLSVDGTLLKAWAPGLSLSHASARKSGHRLVSANQPMISRYWLSSNALSVMVRRGRMELEGSEHEISTESVYRHVHSPGGRRAGLPRGYSPSTSRSEGDGGASASVSRRY